MNDRRIYFDNAASTEVDPRVREAMLPYLGGTCGNPDSRSHPFGWEAEEAVAVAREQVAALIGAGPDEILFTSGATESNNLALFGILRGVATGHLLTTAIEHSALLEPARQYLREGGSVTELAPDAAGRIDPAALRAALRPDTRLVSVQHANNEIGVIQQLAAIGGVCAERGVLLHTDATQSVGKIPIDVRAAGVQLLSCSAHKFHGPKGVGALYVRRRSPRVALRPLLFGGGQERGLRSGTLNVPGIVGMGAAARIAGEEMTADAARVGSLRDRLERGILASAPACFINGVEAERLPGIGNLTFPGISAESLILGLRGVACSAGSACASGRVDPSHVLLALGLAPDRARSSLRFSLGRFNTAEEVDRVIQVVHELLARLERGE
jgi:cysteine desulfurase